MTESVATLTLQDSRLHLGGVVHFDNAEKVCADGVKLLKQADKSLVIDMQELASSNSLVVAILVSWTRDRPGSHDRHICSEPFDAISVSQQDDPVSLFYASFQ